MKATEQTWQQVERVIRKVIEKFPSSEEPTMLTDIHIRVSQENGEVMVFNDDDQEITRCIVEQWIDNKDDQFYNDAANILRQALTKQKKVIGQMSIMKPFSFVLEDEDRESVTELYLVDDDLVIIDEELMADLDKDLDSFLEHLIKE